MKLLIVNHKAFPSVGGKQRYTSRLADGLVALGQEVEVVAMLTPDTGEQEGVSFPTIYRPSFLRLWKAIAGADVVHLNVFSWRAVAIGKLLGKPMLYVYHESGDRFCARALGWRWWEKECGWKTRVPCIWCEQLSPVRSPRHWLFDPLSQRVMDRAVTIVGTCSFFLQRLPRDARYIPYGLPLDLLERAASPSRDFVLFAGRFIREKGPKDVVRGLAECRRRGRELRLVMVGDGPERAETQALAAELGVAGQIEFVGEVPMEVLAEYYKNATVMVVPSVWEEMFGTVSVETMACGTPVIASAVGGMVETVGSAGLLFPPGDFVAMADQILAVVDDPARAAEMSRQGYELARAQYEVSVMVGRYLALYEELAGHAVGSRSQAGRGSGERTGAGSPA